MKLFFFISLFYSSLCLGSGFYSCYTQLGEETQQGAPEFIVTIKGDSAKISMYPPQNGVDDNLEFLTTLERMNTPTGAIVYSGEYTYEGYVSILEFVNFPLSRDSSAGILYFYSAGGSFEGEKSAEALECIFHAEDLEEQFMRMRVRVVE